MTDAWHAISFIFNVDGIVLFLLKKINKEKFKLGNDMGSSIKRKKIMNPTNFYLQKLEEIPSVFSFSNSSSTV